HLWQDTNAGHNIEKTVFVEANAEYKKEGPEEMRPVGETEFVANLAAQSAQGTGATVAAIVGHANMSLGANVKPVLEAHIEAGQGLFRGIRHQGSWDASPDVPNSRINPPPRLFLSESFQEGVHTLGKMNLSFDAWCYHPQLPDVAALAKACPDTTIILNHLGGVIGIGPYANKRDEVFKQWQQNYAALSECPNVFGKLGGLAQSVNGRDWEKRNVPPTSDEIAEDQRPYYLHAIECLGPDRCMFESNFPVEKASVSYHVLYNAFKKIAADFSDQDKDDLFRGTATKAYRLSHEAK
ncbi:MAG: amidohydrolase family protein, partial [Candidatus Latescibacteria bacterium]|nr:amidohydrolase family protein [Candidatus Latescibacterota bacterium]